VEAEGSVRGMRWCSCRRLVEQRINGVRTVGLLIKLGFEAGGGSSDEILLVVEVVGIGGMAQRWGGAGTKSKDDAAEEERRS
jgi:hypothetical protein